MKKTMEDMKITLADAGLKQEAINRAEMLLQAGRTDDLIRHLRLCRCDLMDDLHETQNRVDRMDYLIRQTEKQF